MVENNSRFDIIGDVHGHCDALEELLVTLGYTKGEACYRHPDRIAVFVGDLIDRGPKVRETLELVKSMADERVALVTVGNHEYNAVAYCALIQRRMSTSLRSQGEHLREVKQLGMAISIGSGRSHSTSILGIPG